MPRSDGATELAHGASGTWSPDAGADLESASDSVADIDDVYAWNETPMCLEAYERADPVIDVAALGRDVLDTWDPQVEGRSPLRRPYCLKPLVREN